MRLQKIKLAGFKSFVDPTSIDLTEPLVAIVGPNGCGKSNIIDAVRWVMGESSAKNLRGESLTDVIFNGSSARKPVGQASVELVFDNSDGSLGGEYANFAEISTRRLVTRDNQSLYFLNGVRCRRRDITDIFLGTGIGPRSYAIIEQGMISRVIDAKPEELRAFLEEAAGISLYRRRRQETETRMRHTRENLTRLEDIRLELDKQLERLKRQSESAIKYQEYKQVHDILEMEVATLRWKNHQEQWQSRQEDIQKQTVVYEEKMASRARVDLDLEKGREKLNEESQKLNEIQAEFYDLGAHVARTEQTLEHYRTREKELNEEILSNNTLLQDIQNQIEMDKNREQGLKQDIENQTPKLNEALEKHNEYSKLLLEAEEKMREWTEKFDAFQHKLSASQRTAEVEKARIEQLEKQSHESLREIERLQKELAEFDLKKLNEVLTLLEAQMANAETEATISQDRLDTLNTELNEARASLQNLVKTFDDTKQAQQQCKGQWISEEALQHAALGKSDLFTKEWLTKENLDNTLRLGENITVMAGYESAVETVLGMSLQAICVEEYENFVEKMHNFSKGQLMLIEKTEQESSLNGSSFMEAEPSSLVPLISKVTSSYPVNALLKNIYVVASIDEALTIRSTLQPHESVITQEGCWLSRHWIRVHSPQDSEKGIIERDQEIKSLQESFHSYTHNLETLSAEIEALQQTIHTLESSRENFYKAHQTETSNLKELSGKISGAQARLEYARNRVAKIHEEMASQNQKQSETKEDIASSRLNLQKSLDEMQHFNELRTGLLQERDNLKNILQQIREESRLATNVFHQDSLKMEGLKTKWQAVLEGIDRLQAQYQNAVKQNTKLHDALIEATNPIPQLQKTLDDLLSNRIKVEARLTAARTQFDTLQQECRNLEKQRNLFEQEAESLRVKIETLRIECQGFEVRLETYQEKLTQYQVTAEEVLKNLDGNAEESLWVQKLEEITRKIEKLGAINLAAIEEFQTESERKNYLDAQFKDLTEALETLESAIRKIDRETRQKFKETFDKVNTEFQALFPQLFGGGQAYLTLEGEDLLEAGVTVMARPPGKRNSTIHLLSGGEKALTAVSLIFSIFRLNPAPFCILDEVDAPLDDANVGRFCQLVKHMSSTVQFIYVTHNKISMEMAHHLMGVTMKEPGVSRLVSVDVAKAYALATA